MMSAEIDWTSLRVLAISIAFAAIAAASQA
jgi:hypothetical protein